MPTRPIMLGSLTRREQGYVPTSACLSGLSVTGRDERRMISPAGQAGLLCRTTGYAVHRANARRRQMKYRGWIDRSELQCEAPAGMHPPPLHVSVVPFAGSSTCYVLKALGTLQ